MNLFVTIPVDPGAGTGNRGLAGFLVAASPNVVLDAEFQLNLLPVPGENQRAVDVGITLKP